MADAAKSGWDDKACFELLLAIIAQKGGEQYNWPDVTSRMHKAGYTFNESACRQKFGKIRRSVQGPAEAGEGKAPATPASRKRGPKKATTDDGATPTKRPRTTKAPVKEKAKRAPSPPQADDDDDVISDEPPSEHEEHEEVVEEADDEEDEVSDQA